MRASRIAAALTALVVAACITRLSHVPAAASADDFRRLAGDWSGSYQGEQSGRSGSIVFHIRADSGAAFGDVVMVPKVTNLVVAAPAPATATAPTSQTLSIRFVRISGDSVLGRLEPYRDPETGQTVTTTFTGMLRDLRTFVGTFVTTGNSSEQRGKWKVTRTR